MRDCVTMPAYRPGTAATRATLSAMPGWSGGCEVLETRATPGDKCWLTPRARVYLFEARRIEEAFYAIRRILRPEKRLVITWRCSSSASISTSARQELGVSH